MFRSVFLEDVARLYRAGLLPGACWRLATRPVIWLGYAGIAFVLLFISNAPLTCALLGFLAVCMTYLHVTDCVVHFMTPLCFGSFLIGRMKWKRVNAVRYVTLRSGFILIPSAEELVVTNMAAGTLGKTYVLIRHPADPSIVLPIIDDNPLLLRSIMIYATEARKSEIAAAVDKLRRSEN